MEFGVRATIDVDDLIEEFDHERFVFDIRDVRVEQRLRIEMIGKLLANTIGLSKTYKGGYSYDNCMTLLRNELTKMSWSK